MRINTTLTKYFLSYFLIFSLLFLGSFSIIKGQLTNRYFQQLCLQTQERLNNYVDQLNNDVVYISQVHSSVSQNFDVLMAKYKKTSYYELSALKELMKYDDASELIETIVYKLPYSDTLLSTRNRITYQDGIYYLYYSNGPDEEALLFDSKQYEKIITNQLISLSDDNNCCLLYYPKSNNNNISTIFYILNIEEIQTSLENLTTDCVQALALIDRDNNIAAAINKQALLPYLDTIQSTEGFTQIDEANSLCLCSGISNGLSIIALISNNQLMDQINTAFYTAYLFLTLLGLAGFLLVFLAMKITYTPLYKFTQKVLPSFNHKTEYIKQLNTAFAEAQENILSLQTKLSNYRLCMQKSLLDDAFHYDKADDSPSAPNIDQFFDASAEKEIYVLCVKSPENTLSFKEVQQLIQNQLPGKDTCICLDTNNNDIVFLLNYIGKRTNKEQALLTYFTQLYERKGIMFALSNSSSSPLDIPTLYENAQTASHYWPNSPVVLYSELSSSDSSVSYPHDKLLRLSECLQANNISEVRILVDDLFHDIDEAITSKNVLPDFFIRCILIDIIMPIVETINQAGIKFNTYSELYYETLFLCRSLPYTDAKEQIISNSHGLLDFYELEVVAKTITQKQIRQHLYESYCDPDFSVTALADQLHINPTYMSNLFKDKIGENFSTYLWKLRYDKAAKLLKETDMTIDEISIAVGYLNVKSFRRKFKQETGMTPSEYRDNFKSN